MSIAPGQYSTVGRRQARSDSWINRDASLRLYANGWDGGAEHKNTALHNMNYAKSINALLANGRLCFRRSRKRLLQMRKKRLFINNGCTKASDAPLYESVFAEQQEQRNDNGTITSLLASEMLLVAPDENDFSMEQVYWTAVYDIAATKKISMKEFIDNSQDRFPKLAMKNAVRLSVIKYFQQKAEQQQAATSVASNVFTDLQRASDFVLH